MKAMVLGDAACVHDDASRAMLMFEPDAVAATNNMGINWPHRLDYWCTLHIDPCPDWPGMAEAARRRREAGGNRPQAWAHKPGPGIDRWTPDWRGSTGLLTVKVLMEEGFTHIVLAGVPMTREGGYFYDEKPWTQVDRYRIGWMQHHAEIAHSVRSMSGWTRSILGEPTKDWLSS